MCILTLPFPPSLNHYWRHCVRGKHAATYMAKEGVDFREIVVSRIQAESRKILLGRLYVIIELQAPNRRKYDIDNRAKAVLDALTHAHVWADDSQVDMLTIIRLPPVKNKGLAKVTITTISKEEE